MTRRKGQLGATIILVIFDYFLVVIWLEHSHFRLEYSKIYD